jgi:hypothetical protein
MAWECVHCVSGGPLPRAAQKRIRTCLRAATPPSTCLYQPQCGTVSEMSAVMQRRVRALCAPWARARLDVPMHVLHEVEKDLREELVRRSDGDGARLSWADADKRGEGV